MHRGLAAAILLTATWLPVPAGASHSQGTLPLLAGAPATDAGLSWLADHVQDEGCARPAYGDGCSMANTKWLAISVAHAGLDPATWPSQGSSVLGYLEAHLQDLWDSSAEGCQCPRMKVLSLSKSILAFRAAGQDPSQATGPDGTQRDLVADLLDYHDGDQFGRTDAVNDDIWAVLALNSQGYTGPEIQDALDRITAAQRPNGGVPHEVTSTAASTDNTAAAVMAVAPHDRSTFLDRARSYLADAQVSSGDGRACWPNQPSLTNPQASPESTSWALQAVVALGEDPVAWSVDGRAPTSCLLSFQNDDGGFGSSASNLLATYQATTALAWAPFGTVRSPTEPLQASQSTETGRQTTTSLPDGFLRIGTDARESYTWTPEDPGTRTFHGLSWHPYPRPAVIQVTIDEAPEETAEDPDEEGGTSRTGSSSRGKGPTAQVPAPSTAERNVPLELTVEAEPADAEVVAYRVAWGDGSRTSWSDQPTFEHAYHALGEHEIKAWAKDADGDVSPAATARLEVVDARPRVTAAGPETAHRHTSVGLTAQATDPDGAAPSVTWTWPGGQANGSEVTITLAQPGRTTIEATATDQAGNTARASHEVLILNRAPTIEAVGPLTAEANTTHALTVEASDPDGDGLTITWHDGDRTAYGGQFHLETGPPGQRELMVNVSDPYGAWATATLSINVSETPEDAEPEPPAVERRTAPATQANSSADRADDGQRPTVVLPATVRGQASTATLLEGTARDPDSPVTAVEVVLSDPVPVRGTAGFQALLPALPEGTYPVSARAADGTGWGPWTTTTLVVEPADQQPSGPSEPLTKLGAPAHGAVDAVPLPGLAPWILIAAALLLARRRST